MAKQKTLFEQLKNTEAQEQTPEISLRNSHIVKYSILCISIILVGLLFPHHQNFQDGSSDIKKVSDGILWMNETVKAEYPFAINKPLQEIKADIQFIKEHSSPVFVDNKVSRQKADSNLILLEESLLKSNINQVIKASISADIYQKFQKIDPNTKEKFLQVLALYKSDILDSVYSVKSYVNIQIDSLWQSIIIKKNSLQDIELQRYELIDSLSVKRMLIRVLNNQFDEQTSFILVKMLISVLPAKFMYSESLTNELSNVKIAAVPKTLGIVKAGDIIINKGERIDRMAMLKMQSYTSYRSIIEGKDYSWIVFLGGMGHSFMIFSMLILYLYFIRPNIFKDNYKVMGLCGIMLLASLSGWFSIIINSNYPLEYAVIVPALSMLIAILFDSRTAFYSTVVMSLLIAGIRGSDYSVGLAMMMGGMLAAYSVRDIKSRTQIFQSILFVMLGFALTIISISAERTLDISETLLQLGVAGVNSVFSPLLTFGILYIIERVFNITTDLRLKEYDNVEHPLLLEMSEKSPGTYQHTLTIARLSESAAIAIGANGLLAKVGAYFHDIGKIPKAEYYVENQINIDNKHDKLSPKKSASIIRDHVQDGIELAIEYKLPQRIIDFIPMHHGTMLIKHFYAKAIEFSNIGEGSTIVKMEDYRYIGPKPVTKETAIVMLADAAEAIARAANADNREDIVEILDSIVKDRFLDGQFDECPITMAEIQEVKESFAKNLLGMRHHRVMYKEIPIQES